MRWKIFLQIFVMICVVSVLYGLSVDSVSAADTVCCEETIVGGFCEYVPQGECKQGVKQAPTSCENTAYCKPGCYIDNIGEGYCYSNYPRAKAEGAGGQWDPSADCNEVPDCVKGCCIIGTQAAYVTENRCKKETAGFSELKMDFRTAANEKECLEIAHTADKGACVTNLGICTYTTDAECNFEREEINVTDNSTIINVTKSFYSGFYKDKYCSALPFVSCTAGKASNRLGCLPDSDDVYYFDSCGNPEEVAIPCDYAKGKMCGDTDGDGKFTCESLTCGSVSEMLGTQFKLDDSTNYDWITNKEGVLHGESWCLYDYDVEGVEGGDEPAFALSDHVSNLRDITYASREPVGSRNYRAICINGKQFVEPCADYRTEWCLQGSVVGDGVTLGGATEYTEARCIENRWQSCIDECNTANASMGENEWNAAQIEDQDCCGDITQRDCAWVGKCVPRVSPGTKFWEDEGTNNCGKASISCSFVVKCDAWDRIFTWGSCDPNWFTSSIGRGLGAILGWESEGGAAGWTPVSQEDADRCLSGDFTQAANNLCRSYGDCGASYNLEGDITYEGFSTPDTLGSEYDSFIGDKLEKNIINESGEQPDWALGSSTLDYKIDGTAGFDWYDDVWDFDDFSRPETWGTYASIAGVIGQLSVGLAAELGTIAGPLAGLYGNSFVQGAFPFASTKGLKAAVDTATKGVADAKSALGVVKGKIDAASTAALKAQNEATNAAAKAYEKGASEAIKKSAKEAAELPFKANEDLALLNKEATGLSEKLTTSQGELDTAQQGTGGWATTMQVVSAYMWIKMAYDLVNMVGSKSKTLTVQSMCTNWQAPKTIDDCELCNPDYEDYVDSDGKPLNEKAFKTCSEYRCKSYGASCSLINVGTENETCVSMNQYDVNSPIIEVWTEGLQEEYREIELLNNGFKIKKEIPIYNRVVLAVQTDEPAQCKMNFNHTNTYDEMGENYFGSTSYSYFHQQPIFYPTSKNYTEEGVQLTSGGTYSLYVRCSDAVGNTNVPEYLIRFTVSNEPDLTAPIIEFASIDQEAYVTAGQNDTEVSLFINEPAQCRWSKLPLSYSAMESENKDIVCTTTIDALTGYFECKFNGDKKLTGIGGGLDKLTTVYFKCRDKPLELDVNKRNTNKEAFEIKFRGSQELNITSVEPSGEIFLNLEENNVELEVVTEGGAKGNGDADCKYTLEKTKKNKFQSMDDTLDSVGNVHKKILTGLNSGEHTIWVGCKDDAGNMAYNETTFVTAIDEFAPVVIKYYWTEDILGHLVFKISENADCEYSVDNPSFKFGIGEGANTFPDGIKHETNEESSVYYVICNDTFGNSNENKPYIFRRF